MAWYFGSTAHLTIADHPALTMGIESSFSCWVKIPDDRNNQIICSWGRFEDFPNFIIMYWGTQQPSTPGTLLFYIIDASGAAQYHYSAAIFESDNWIHLCMTRGAGGVLRAYVNGALIGTATNASMGEINAQKTFYIGSIFGGGDYFQGNMGEIAKYARTLSSGEISGLAAGANPCRYPRSLDYYWSGREGMMRDTQAGLSVTNHGTILSEHPPVELPPQTGIIQPVIQRALGV